jgi:transposase-like protein
MDQIIYTSNINPNQQYKICTKCNTNKPLTSFAINKVTLDGLQYMCRSCQKDYRDQNKERYKQNNLRRYGERRDEILAFGREWKLANKAHVTEVNKQYRHNNVEKFRQYALDAYYDHHQAYMKELRKTNPDLAYKAARAWSKLNPGKDRAQTAKRRARLMQATPGWAEYKEIMELYIQCTSKSRDTGISHHVDHIVPLRGKLVCGLHCTDNLQIITAEENMSKGNTWNI